VEISCDGKYKIWNGRIMQMDMGEKMKEKCTEGTNKAQFYMPNWNEDPKKWECGWYDEKADQIHAYHYTRGKRNTGEGHQPGDSFYGWIDRSKRTKTENCPTLEDKRYAPALGNDASDLLAKMAGKWQVHYDLWSENRSYPVEISCDGKYKIWNGRIMQMDMGEKMKEKCTEGTNKAQFYMPNWNEDPKKWECGWYDEKADQIHAYHYTRGKRNTGEGHQPGDSFYGWIDRSKRTKTENCPTLEDKRYAPALGNATALLDCRSMSLAATCPSTSDKKECHDTSVEYDGVRYVCYFTETTYGSISRALKENRCNVDMNSKICQQVW